MSLVLIAAQNAAAANTQSTNNNNYIATSSTSMPNVQSPIPAQRSSAKTTHFLHPKNSVGVSKTGSMFANDETASTTTGRFSRLSNTTGKSITRSIVMTRYLNAQLEKMQSNLYQKFAQSQNYYYTRDLNDLLGGARTKYSIEFRDWLVYDEEEEYLKRIYAHSEYPVKIKLLTEYYKFHSDIPRLFMHPLCNNINTMHDKKRRLEFFRIAKVIEEENKKNPNKPPKGIVGEIPPPASEESFTDKKDAKKKDQPIDKNLINFLKDISTYINRGPTTTTSNQLESNLDKQYSMKPAGLNPQSQRNQQFKPNLRNQGLNVTPQVVPTSDTLVDINQRLADIIHQSFASSTTEINDITVNHNLDDFLRFLKTSDNNNISSANLNNQPSNNKSSLKVNSNITNNNINNNSSVRNSQLPRAGSGNPNAPYSEAGKSSILARNLGQYDSNVPSIPKSEGVINYASDSLKEQFRITSSHIKIGGGNQPQQLNQPSIIKQASSPNSSAAPSGLSAGADLKINLNGLASSAVLSSHISQSSSSQTTPQTLNSIGKQPPSGQPKRLQTVSSLQQNNVNNTNSISNVNSNSNQLELQSGPLSQRNSQADLLPEDQQQQHQQQQQQQHSQLHQFQSQSIRAYPLSSRNNTKEALFAKQATKTTTTLSARTSLSNTPVADSKLAAQFPHAQATAMMKTSTFSQAVNPAALQGDFQSQAMLTSGGQHQFKISKIKRNSSSNFTINNNNNVNANANANQGTQQQQQLVMAQIEQAVNLDVAAAYSTSIKFRSSGAHPQQNNSISPVPSSIQITPSDQQIPSQSQQQQRHLIKPSKLLVSQPTERTIGSFDSTQHNHQNISSSNTNSQQQQQSQGGFSIQNVQAASVRSNIKSTKSISSGLMDQNGIRSMASFNTKQQNMTSSSSTTTNLANSSQKLAMNFTSQQLAQSQQQQSSYPQLLSGQQSTTNLGSQTHRPYIQPSQQQMISQNHHRQMSIPFIQNLSKDPSQQMLQSGGGGSTTSTSSGSNTNSRMKHSASPSATGLNFYSQHMVSNANLPSSSSNQTAAISTATSQSPKLESGSLRVNSNNNNIYSGSQQQNEEYFQRQNIKTMSNGFGYNNNTITSPRGKGIGTDESKKAGFIEGKGLHKYTRSDQQQYSSTNGSSSARQFSGSNASHAQFSITNSQKDLPSMQNHQAQTQATTQSSSSSLAFEPAAKFRSSIGSQSVKALQQVQKQPRASHDFVQIDQSSATGLQQNLKNVSPKKTSLFSK